ncbi:MAG: hypothetical protein M5U01_05515 [Ardenticatenaceae bacterium]|nr:hypothetical protein [Ardenticatenaceae bacterium]
MPDFREDRARLEAAARAGDEAAFARVVAETDWSRAEACDFVEAVRLALAGGAPLTARSLADAGVRAYPEHVELHKMARILAPPRIVGTSGPSQSLCENQRWLREHADEYRERWVAVREGKLVASGMTAAEIRAHLGSRNGVMVTRVF